MRHEKIPPVPEEVMINARLMARDPYRPSSNNRHNYYTACDLCGYVAWTSARDLKEGEEPTVTVGSGGYCPRCQDMLARYPEVVNWVATVLGYHLERWHDPENVEKSQWALDQWALERKASTP